MLRCDHGFVDAEHIGLSDFEAEDQGAVKSLILAGLADHWGTVDEKLNPDLDDIAASHENGRVIVVRLDGVIVATGTIVPSGPAAAEIRRMSVRASCRRTGIGRLIVEELLTTARLWGAADVLLETTAHWDDVVAFYLSCGFKVTHEETGPFGIDMWFRRQL